MASGRMLLPAAPQLLGDACVTLLGGDYPISRVQFTVPTPAPDFQRDQRNCDSMRSLALRREIPALISKNAIERVDQRIQQGGFYLLYFLISKKDGGFRRAKPVF